MSSSRTQHSALKDRLEIGLDQTVAKMFPGYRLLDEIASGGQGTVYKAIQDITHRPVAIKTLHGGILASRESRERIFREARLAARLRHPRTVKIFDSGFVNGTAFVVMEYIDGIPINDHVMFEELSIRAIVALLRDVCSAISHAHNQGVIHRDIKPSNILVDIEGQAFVCDFGLAREQRSDGSRIATARLSKTGQLVGTLLYVSPEQLRGEHPDGDVLSDVYALGLVLYECLTGVLPRGQESLLAASTTPRADLQLPSLRQAWKVQHDKPPPRALNRDLEAIVQEATSFDRSRRYQSAAALGDDLDRFLQGDAVDARRRHGAYTFWRATRRHRVAIGVATAFMLLLTIGLVSSFRC